jgi:hypothetical protein
MDPSRESTNQTNTVASVDARRTGEDSGAWLVKTTNSYFRVVYALNRYFVTKLEHHNAATRAQAITHPGDSWSGHTLVLRLGVPMVLYNAEGIGVVRTTRVIDIQR